MATKRKSKDEVPWWVVVFGGFGAAALIAAAAAASANTEKWARCYQCNKVVKVGTDQCPHCGAYFGEWRA